MANVELRIEGKELVQLRTIICGSCKHLRRDTCSVSGMPYQVHTVGFECPKDKQADDNGHVRRFFMRWVGIPAPVRWWKAWRGDRRWLSSPGCGCIVWLKRLWIKVRS